MKSKSITFVLTGGTIDKDYQTTTGELIFTESHLPQLVEEANCTLKVDYKTVMLKDSLEMTLQDRENILQTVEKIQNSYIIITHGTDTMAETARFLKQADSIRDKTIVLTGAMRPYKLGNSDAQFNIGCAIMAAQMAQSGIYLTMNGQLFNADQVSKNREKGQFERLL